MKKMIIASIAATLLLSPAAAYADNGPAQPAQPAQPAATASFKLTADTSVQKADLDAFANLKKMFDANQVDLQKVKASYISSFQTKVKDLIPDTDTLILAVLDGAINGKFSAAQAKQAIDKGLQGYFYAEIGNLTKTVAKTALSEGKKEAARTALEQAIELYAGALQGTVMKRDASYELNMQEQLNSIIIPGLQAAVEKGDVLAFSVHRQMFDKTLIKVFHLGTITYAKKVPELAASKPADAQVGLTEGFFFYLPIYNSMTGGHKPSADAIKAAFESGNLKLDEAAIKDAFLKTLIAKISGYADKVLAADLKVKENHEKAQEQAMEGNMFLSVAEILLKERLDKIEQGYTGTLINEGQLYYEAVKAGNRAEAAKHVHRILEGLSLLDGVSFQPGSFVMVINGKEFKSDAPSLVESGRTLVPARALAEALGGKINAAKTGSETKITIEKDGSVVEFVIGGKEVTKDGKKLEFTFDQPAVIKGGRTYIPLRAVSQVLGQKVFFDEDSKKVIVLK